MSAVFILLLVALNFCATAQQDAVPALVDMAVRRRVAHHEAGHIMANHLNKDGAECLASDIVEDQFMCEQFKKSEVKEAIKQLANALLQRNVLQCNDIKRIIGHIKRS